MHNLARATAIELRVGVGLDVRLYGISVVKLWLTVFSLDSQVELSTCTGGLWVALEVERRMGSCH